MSHSFHDFFFGAYEPAGSVSIDKPPIDLWFQVASVKLFGFGSTQLKLPEALGGTLAVPLLCDAVRRVCGTAAGLASALAMAVLPVAVLTARSDTMDAVMMLMTVAALWCVVRFGQTNSSRWLYLAAAWLGVAFNVKLFQAFVCLPALGLMVLLFTSERRWRRLAVAAVVFVCVSLSWLGATLLTPASQRPWAIGSTNGSAWNAAFVFNGYDRIAEPASVDLGGDSSSTSANPRANTEVARSAIPIGAPSPLRLFSHNGPLSGLRLGYLLIVSLLLGIPALLLAALRPRAPMERPFAIGMLVWLLTGVVLYTEMARLHPRYTEGFTPAVAAAAGIGLAWVVSGSRRRALAAAATAIVLVAYDHWLRDGATAIWLATAGSGIAVVAACALPDRLRRPALWASLIGVALIFPLHISVGLIEHSESDGGRVGYMTPSALDAFSRYLTAHRGSARYEFASEAATGAASLIVHDDQPVLMLTSFNGQPLTSVARLATLVHEGAVRYAILTGDCGAHESRKLPVCSAQAAWVRAHGRDVSRAAGLPHAKLLWRL
jgi:4-amino-4-deoxy-L-arabinose transferase-like glycosyltransferase